MIGDVAGTGWGVIQGARVCLRNDVATVNDIFHNGAIFYPQTDNTIDLGQSGKRWKNVYVAGTLLAGGGLSTTPLNADNLTSGTVPDARLSVNVLKHTGGYPGGTTTYLRADGTFVAPPTGGVPAAHATTHQPGGSDAMAVDAIAATGSLRTLGTGANQAAAGNDTRLSNARNPVAHAITHTTTGGDPISVEKSQMPASVAYEDEANFFTATPTAPGLITESNGPTIVMKDTSQGVNLKTFHVYNGSQTFRIRPVDDAGGSYLSNGVTIDRTGALQAATNIGATGYLYDRARPLPIGYWQSVPFSAANFNALAPLTLTVAAGNVEYNNYAYMGHMLWWIFGANSMTLGGSPSNQVYISTPGGFTHQISSQQFCHIYNGTWQQAIVRAAAGQAAVTINKLDFSNFVTGIFYAYFNLTLGIS